MAMNKYNDDIQQRCIQGLKELRVIPADYGTNNATGVAVSKPLEFSHSGGRMRVADTRSPASY
jgi:hypothetical protein